tara:strand:+ start:4152 stop:6803 length:2652 start_codon:yes stop_codon:yes gene_type:complete
MGMRVSRSSLSTCLFPIAAFLIGAGTLAGLGTGHAQTAVPAPHPLGVEDVLDLSVYGQAQFSPDGKWLAYNVTPPYDELGDYSYWLYAYGLSGHQLWIREVAANGPPRLQPGLDPEATNYLAGISPDSRWVLVLEHKAGRLRFVGCRLGKDDCHRFDGEPDIRDGYFTLFSWNERIEWVSGHAFLMPVRPDSLPGSERHARGLVGQMLWRDWNLAWSGKAPTASEMISTGHEKSEDWADGRLMEFDLATGEARLVRAGRYAGPKASPDGQYVAAARVGERVRPPSDVPLETARTHPRFDRRYALHLIDLATGDVKALQKPYTVDPGSITWSVNGDRLSVFGWEEGETPHEGEYYVIDTASFTPVKASHAGLQLADRNLAPDPADFSGPTAGALLDTGPVVYARPESGGTYGWYVLSEASLVLLTQGLERVSPQLLGAGRTDVRVLSPDGVYLASPAHPPKRLMPVLEDGVYAVPHEIVPEHGWSGEFRFGSGERLAATDPRPRPVSVRRRNGDDSAVRFTGSGGKGDTPTEIETGVSGARLLAASAPASAALVTRRIGSATDLLLLQKSRAPQSLARINDGLDLTLPVADASIRYQLSDPEGGMPDRTMDGCLSLPPDYEAGRRYPVILDIYPVGLPGRCRHVRDMPRPEALASDLWTSLGFIYFRPAMPLDFARTNESPIGGMPDLAEQSARALVGQGYADPDRIVLLGISQGAVTALYISARSDRFAAVIAMNGWSDFLSHYFGARGITTYLHLDQNGGDNRWRYDCVGEGAQNRCPFGFGETPFEHPDAYAETSPVVLASRIDIPVLLVHSDMDYISMSQFDEMFGALYRAGKEARYVRYWGEGHTPSSPANIRDLWRRMGSFLAECGIRPEKPAMKTGK